MNNMMIRTFKPTAMAVALALAFGNAIAQEDAAQLLIKPESSISVGIGNWSNDRLQQGIYDGMREGKAYGLLDLDLVKRYEDTGTWLTLTGSNLGLDTRELRAEWLRQGDIGVSIEYSRLTRENPLIFSTLLQGAGTTNQVVNGNAQLQNMSLGTARDLTQLGFYKSFSKETELKISFKNEEKNGTRHWGMGGQPYFLVEPIDSTTRQLEVMLSFAGERLQLSGGYYGSQFLNQNSSVIATATGVAIGNNNPVPLTLPLDNQAHQIYFNGGYSFTTSTRGTFKLSYATATQDETLPTFAGLGGVAQNTPFVGAPSSLNGKVNTTLLEIGLTSRPIKNLSLVANLRYNDVKDKTPVAQFISTGVYNTPHSITTKSGKLEGTYRLQDGFSLTGGVDYKDQNRSAPTLGSIYVPFRTAIEETTYRLQLRRGLSETVNGSLVYLHSKRDGSGDVAATVGGLQRAMNPLHISDRKRDKWRGMLDWSPTDKLSVQFSLEDARDSYDFRPPASAAAADQAQGRKNGSANMYALDASYTFNEFWQVNAWYSLDVAKAQDLSIQAAATQKISNLKETGDAFGLGFKGQLSSKLKLGANFEWFKTVSKFDQTVGATAAPLPDINSRLARLKMFGEYALDKQSDLRLEVIHERWRSNDWTWTFSNGTPFVYGSPDGTTVLTRPTENTTFIGARYIYNFQ